MEASDQNGGAASPDLAPDVATTQGSIDTSDAVALVGYLGEGDSDKHRRLYETVALNRWIEILVPDILDRLPAPIAGQSVIWVRRDAHLVLCESARASDYEGPAESDPGAEIPLRWPRP